MTEAISGLIKSARQKSDIGFLNAETEETNLPSQKILQNNNFIKSKKEGNMIWWKLKP